MNVLKPHISLNVSAIEPAVAFSEKEFGVAATKRRPGYSKFDLESRRPVMKADAANCCAPVGISKKVAAASPGCCAPAATRAPV